MKSELYVKCKCGEFIEVKCEDCDFDYETPPYEEIYVVISFSIIVDCPKCLIRTICEVKDLR